MQKYLINIAILLIGIVIGITITKHFWGVNQLNSEIDLIKKEKSELIEIINDNAKILQLLNNYDLAEADSEQIKIELDGLISDIKEKQRTAYSCGYRIIDLEADSNINAIDTVFSRHTFIVQEYGIAWDYIIPQN
ncbi:hypothetical protein [Marinifilum flexuosum]|uniref:Uncharacterized protein n=1 Tax=Marinifilum flexuosum TaxID=1117708 RepID=A0A419XA95_9BACT|nr:hypothetical protein [Marinifilum flexuosum]RKE04661.1 hypothetical protein BXY64_1688 [Marinifilum flexuosum]